MMKPLIADDFPRLGFGERRTYLMEFDASRTLKSVKHNTVNDYKVGCDIRLAPPPVECYKK
jgi:hypothetical protein